ncbi:MAG: hypothetical protein ACJ8C4_01810 [Gemmataceae bacterium]
MTQHQLNCAVARTTGESLDRVRRTGFSEMPMPRLMPLRFSGLYQRARQARHAKKCQPAHKAQMAS